MLNNTLRFITSLIIFSLFCFSPLISAHTPAAPLNNQTSIAPMLKQVMPAIVNISVEQVTMKKLNDLIPTRDDRTKIPVKTYAVGSGVIFDAFKGLMVTNAHVVKDEKVIIVTLNDGRRFHAALVAKDPGYDIAILKIDASNLSVLAFADSDAVQVGDFVTAIGSPYGLSQSVTSGVVSAINRSHPQIEGYQNFIQTDAPINPGNSGGALVNLQGKLVGINTAIIGPSEGNAGIGFAIPSNMADAVIQQLLKYGKVEHGVLGVMVQNLTPALADTMKLATQKGALVSDVLPNTPAASAGFQPSDLITHIDGHSIQSSDQLRNTLGLIRPDTSVAITIIRNNQTKTLHATLSSPKNLKDKESPYIAGLRLQPFHELEPQGTTINGLLITDVSDESAGALAGLEPGDVITAIDKKPVSSVETLLQTIRDQTQPVLLTVARGSSHLFLVLRAH